MECVAYLRVSTEKQAEEGNGLDSQRRDIEIYAQKNDLEIKEWYVDDGYTGANMERPAMQKLIGDCASKKVKCVVAFKLDRISRSMVDGIYIIERIFQPNNVKFFCVHDSVSYDSPMEQAYTQMMAVFAQLDKNTMLLRMRGGMLERVKQGYWMGGGNLPWCYNYDSSVGILVPISERVQMANDALDLYLEGYSDEYIQKILGFKTEKTLVNVLTGIVNIGKIPYKGEVYQGRHQPIFTEERFNRGLEERKRRSKKRTVRTEYMLTGLIYCGDCGCSMRYQKWNAGRTRIYCCSRNNDRKYLPNYNPDCQSELYWADDIEGQVEEAVKKICLNVKKENTEREKNDSVKIFENQLLKEQSRLKRLYELYSDGNDLALDMIQEKEKEINLLKEKIDNEKNSRTVKQKTNITRESIKKISDIWDSATNLQKNRMLKLFVERIYVHGDKIEVRLKNF